MSNDLLKKLRALTESVEVTTEKKVNEEGFSVKDILAPEQKPVEDQEAPKAEEDSDLEDEFGDDGDLSDVEDNDSVRLLKDVFNACDEVTQESIVAFAKSVVDNEVTLDALKDFVAEVDLEFDDEDDDFEDMFDLDDEEHEHEHDHEDEDDEDEEKFGESLEEESEEANEEYYGESFDKINFLNESNIYDDFDSIDLLDLEA